MSLDERLRDGLEGLDALEGAPSQGVVESVLGRGRRSRRSRRLAAAALVFVIAVAAFVVAPSALDALRGLGERRPANPGFGVGVITTVAGSGGRGYAGDGGPAPEAWVNYPVDLDFDSEGNLYILELGHGDLGFNSRVRKVDSSGQITTVAGPGASGQAGRLVLGTTFGTTGLAVDAAGNIYLGGGNGPDIVNRVIRVDPSGSVTAVAGTGEPGFSGDGGPATKAELRNVWDVAIDSDGNLYITGNNRIRRVDTRGVITTIVGEAAHGFSGDGGAAVEAETDRITGVTVDAVGNIYFIDYGNGRIRKIDTTGIITTIAGPGTQRHGCFLGVEGAAATGEGVPATQALTCGPEHLDVDGYGNVFIADTASNRIRMIDTHGIIHTVAGSGDPAYSGDRGPALEAELSEPSGVAVGPDGAIYIADSGNDRVRKVLA